MRPEDFKIGIPDPSGARAARRPALIFSCYRNRKESYHAARAAWHHMGASATPRFAIQVSRIRKTYGATVAVSEVSFDVSEGEVFGLIGPNGAGKTTTMECVEGVRRPDGGEI